MTETMSLAEVKAHLSQLVSRVNAHHDRVTVTVHGRPSAVLLSVDDLEALEETIAILSDSDALTQLAASDAELARGEGESEQDLADAVSDSITIVDGDGRPQPFRAGRHDDGTSRESRPRDTGLERCRRAAADGSLDAALALRGIEAVSSGAGPSFQTVVRLADAGRGRSGFDPRVREARGLRHVPVRSDPGLMVAPHPLDDMAWHALSGPHAPLAVIAAGPGGAAARRPGRPGVARGRSPA